MDVTIIPFDDKYTAETLQLMKEWSTDHPELSRKEIYDWQRSTRWLAMKAIVRPNLIPLRAINLLLLEIGLDKLY